MSSFKVSWRRLPPMLAAVAAAAALAGCGSSSTTTHMTASAPPAAPTKATNGIAIPSDPRRIVSLSASSTEDLYAVGAGSQVVAVDSYSNYPPNAPRTKLSGYQPNIEAIAKYNPDLVVTYQNINHVSEQLAALHIPVLIERPPGDLSGAYEQITQLGAATGHPHEAARVIATTRAQVASILASIHKPPRPLSVYHELDQTYYAASSHTFVGQIYALLGLSNIADKAAKASVYPQLSSEAIIAANPSLIVLADTICCHQSLATVTKRPGWSGIAAVKSRTVLAVDDSIASQWGPRIVLFLRAVATEVRKLEAGK